VVVASDGMPKPNPSNVYDDEERARAYAALGFPGTYYLAFRDLPALFERHVVGTRALDFGCGTGRSTRYLRDLGFDAVGVDISRPMLEKAREIDPEGDYRLVAEGDLGELEDASFDLALSAFTFDNMPTNGGRQSALLALRQLLAPGGRIVNVVSSPDIYVNEWVSFSTRDYPRNRRARSGDEVHIVMLDVPDRRPVVDFMCTDEDYRVLYDAAGLSVIGILRPLATGSEPVEWVSETEIAPWVIYVLGSDG
jgi:SAM-dependent methyltransferase